MKRIFGWALLGAGFLIITFFRNYSGNVIPYPGLLLLLGFSCWGGSFFLFLDHSRKKRKRTQSDEQLRTDDLKKNGNSIPVDLENCELLENNYTEDRLVSSFYDDNKDPVKPLSLQELDRQRETSRRNARFEEKQVIQIRVVYKTVYAGTQRVFYSPILSKDRDTLLFKFAIRKITKIYISKQDPDLYYFDLEFLDN